MMSAPTCGGAVSERGVTAAEIVDGDAQTVGAIGAPHRARDRPMSRWARFLGDLDGQPIGGRASPSRSSGAARVASPSIVVVQNVSPLTAGKKFERRPLDRCSRPMPRKVCRSEHGARRSLRNSSRRRRARPAETTRPSARAWRGAQRFGLTVDGPTPQRRSGLVPHEVVDFGRKPARRRLYDREGSWEASCVR